MKKYRIYNNETEMSIEKLLDTACMSCLKDFGNGFDPIAKKLVVEAIKKQKGNHQSNQEVRNSYGWSYNRMSRDTLYRFG